MEKIFWLRPDGGFSETSAAPGERLQELAISLKESGVIPEDWIFHSIGESAPFSVELAVGELKSKITQMRWEVETGGITLPSGVRVATGIDDQNRITSVVANAERAGLEQVDFKAADGWAKVTLAELQAIATAVALHVQACFSAERAHHETIDALVSQHQGDAQALQAALDGYDESQGWPA